MLKTFTFIFLITTIFNISNKLPAQTWADFLIQNATENFDAYINEATKDSANNNPGAAFISVCLRNFPFQGFGFPDLHAYVTEGPMDEDCEIQLKCALESRGFSKPIFDASLLQKGDIVFTQDQVPYKDELWPTHAFFFIEWKEPGNTESAYIFDFHGYYIERNITGEGEYVKFQYFMRSPFDNIAATSVNKQQNLNLYTYPNPATDVLNIKLSDTEGAFFNLSIINQTGHLVYLEKDINISTNNNYSININALPPGVYFLLFQDYADKTKNISQKFIISK